MVCHGHLKPAACVLGPCGLIWSTPMFFQPLSSSTMQAVRLHPDFSQKCKHLTWSSYLGISTKTLIWWFFYGQKDKLLHLLSIQSDKYWRDYSHPKHMVFLDLKFLQNKMHTSRNNMSEVVKKYFRVSAKPANPYICTLNKV